MSREDKALSNREALGSHEEVPFPSGVEVHPGVNGLLSFAHQSKGGNLTVEVVECLFDLFPVCEDGKGAKECVIGLRGRGFGGQK